MGRMKKMRRDQRHVGRSGGWKGLRSFGQEAGAEDPVRTGLLSCWTPFLFFAQIPFLSISNTAVILEMRPYNCHMNSWPLFFKKIIYLFIFGCARSLLMCRVSSNFSVRVSHCGRFSCCGARALGHLGFSGCCSPALESRFCSSGARDKLLDQSSLFWESQWEGVERVKSVLDSTPPLTSCMTQCKSFNLSGAHYLEL